MDALRPCPDSALLAAFIDGTLNDYERTAVVSHLCECPQCRSVALTVVEIREVESRDALWHRPAPLAPAPLVETGEHRWSREKTRAPALVFAAVATIAAIAIPAFYIFPSWSSRSAMTTLVEATAGQRPLLARVSGGFSYAAFPTSLPARDSSAPARLLAVAERIRDAHQNDYGVPSRRASGVAALLTGDLDAAVFSLSVAAAAAPNDANLANDLAAAYYERSQRDARPADLPAALEAVEIAIAQNPALTEAWFNRALIISGLGMRIEAQAAWREYLSRDRSSPWANEARARLDAVSAASTAPDWVSLRDVIITDTTPHVAEQSVKFHSGRARDLFDKVLFKAWLDEARAGRETSAAARRLAIMGDAFFVVNEDRFYRDVAAAVESASVQPADRRLTFVGAHQAFFELTALIAANGSNDAAAALRRVESQLAAVGSPYASRARIEAATAAFSNKRFAQAAVALTTEKETARSKGYRALATRASWILGMANFGLNDLAAARVHYEEMLQSAASSGDADVYVMANVLLGNLHDSLGDNEQAWRYRIEAATRVDDCYTTGTPANMLVSAAGHAMAGGHLAAALLFQSRFLALEPSGPLPEVQMRTQRASLLHRLNEGDAASAELGLARTRLPRIADSTTRALVEADLLAIESEIVEPTDVRRSLLLATQAVATAGEGADLLRRSRLRMRWAEAMLASGDIDGADRTAGDAIAALDEFRGAMGDQASPAASDQAVGLYSRATEIALRRGDVTRAFDYSERRRIQNTAELRAGNQGPRRLPSIQAALADDTALTVLTQVGAKLHVWVIRRNDVATHRLDLSTSRAAGLVAAHLDELNRRSASPAVSAELFDTLLRPVQRLLAGARNVVVVADAPYSQIAFAGLWNSRTNRFLIEDHRLVASPSATAYLAATALANRRAAAAPNASRMLLATTSSSQGGSLEGALVTGLASAYPAGFRRDSDSTPADLQRDIAEGDVVHVSAPLAADRRVPLRSRLLMADEPGRRYSGAVSALQLARSPVVRARLVALETRSVSGREVSAGVSGFANALLATGVATVVGPIAQMPASNLEVAWLDFHRHYAAGTTAAESLRRAQLAALEQSKRHTGPWATLTVFGSTE